MLHLIDLIRRKINPQLRSGEDRTKCKRETRTEQTEETPTKGSYYPFYEGSEGVDE
jgi:hypothetical protein